MDKIDLEELERLHKAATPGPWEAWIMKQPLYHAIMPSDYPLRPPLGQTKHDADARFIVAACNAVPELIAENRALQERVRDLERQRRYLATNAALGCHDHSAVLHRRDCWDCPFDGKACYTINLEDWLNAAEQDAKEAGE